MKLEFRKARMSDLPRILTLYADARAFMAAAGNPNQWTDGYPGEADVLEDLYADRLYVCLHEGTLAAVFCYYQGTEPDYLQIFQGDWLNHRPYGVVHRIAAGLRGKGIASACLDFAFAQCGNLRIDTHRDNLPMQRMLEKNDFRRCGIIYLGKNGHERLAYQKCKKDSP